MGTQIKIGDFSLEAVYAKTREVMAEDASFLSHTALKMTEFCLTRIPQALAFVNLSVTDTDFC